MEFYSNNKIIIYASITLFSFIGYVSNETGIPIEEMPVKGMELGFVVYPNLLNTLPFPHLWCIIFFAMLTSLGLGTEYVFVEAVSGLVYGVLKKSGKFHRSQTFVTGILVGVILLFNLVFFASSAGYYWLETVDHYATGINLVVFLFIQLVALVYILPLSNLEKRVNKYGEKFPRLYDFSLRYICPVFALFLSCTAIINEFKREHSYNNIFEFLLCWIILLTPICLFILFFFWSPYNDKGKPVDMKLIKLDKLLEESFDSKENDE